MIGHFASFIRHNFCMDHCCCCFLFFSCVSIESDNVVHVHVDNSVSNLLKECLSDVNGIAPVTGND